MDDNESQILPLVKKTLDALTAKVKPVFESGGRMEYKGICSLDATAR
jgi:hypothetical protein